MDAQEDKGRSRVVAARVFRTATGGEVIATIHEPVMLGPDEWHCDFRIAGLGREVNDRGRGEDSLQALIVALDGLRVHLAQAPETLSWDDGEPGDFGIPPSIPHGYGPEVEKHLTSLLNDEVSRLAQEKWKRKDRP